MIVKGWAQLHDELGLYELEKKDGSGWCWRSLALRLTDGTFAVFSPIQGTAGRLAALRDFGLSKLGLVVAPNHFHYLGVPDLLREHPEVGVVTSPTAARRLRGKLKRDLSPLDALRERLPKGVSVLEPPGLKTGEIWLSAQTSRGLAWIVCDAFFHVTHEVRGAMGWALKLTATVPGLRIGNTFRWMALGDRRAYREWLEAQLRDEPPRVLIPSHGDVLEDDDLGGKLAELAARRL